MRVLGGLRIFIKGRYSFEDHWVANKDWNEVDEWKELYAFEGNRFGIEGYEIYTHTEFCFEGSIKFAPKGEN